MSSSGVRGRASVCEVAEVDDLEDSPDETDPKLPCGLYNMGNSCYANAAMQSLAYSSPIAAMIRYICRFHVRKGFYNSDSAHAFLVSRKSVRNRRDLICHVHNLWTEMSNGRKTSISPNALIRAVIAVNPMFRGHSQQDSHELLQCILGTIHEEAALELAIDMVASKMGLFKSAPLAQSSISKSASNLTITFPVCGGVAQSSPSPPLPCPFGESLYVLTPKTLYSQRQVQFLKCLHLIGLENERLERMDRELKWKNDPKLNSKTSLDDYLRAIPKRKMAHSLVSDVFEGYQLCEVECKCCKHVSRTAEPIMGLILSFPTKAQRLKLQQISANLADGTAEPSPVASDISPPVGHTRPLFDIPEPSPKTTPQLSLYAPSQPHGVSLAKGCPSSARTPRSPALSSETITDIVDASLGPDVTTDFQELELEPRTNTSSKYSPSKTGRAGSAGLSKSSGNKPATSPSKSKKRTWTLLDLHFLWLVAIFRYLASLIGRLFGALAAPPSAPVTLEDCIAAYCMDEDLMDKNRYFCSHCQSLQEASKRMYFLELPEILPICFKRTQHNTYWSCKTSEHVQFPMPGQPGASPCSNHHHPSGISKASVQALKSLSPNPKVGPVPSSSTSELTEHAAGSGSFRDAATIDAIQYTVEGGNGRPISLPPNSPSPRQEDFPHRLPKPSSKLNLTAPIGCETTPTSRFSTSLDLSPWCYVDQSVGLTKPPVTTYSLFAVINHHGGGGSSGHYTAFVLRNGRWFLCNDERVRPASADEVAKSSAFMLFYRKETDADPDALLTKTLRQKVRNFLYAQQPPELSPEERVYISRSWLQRFLSCQNPGLIFNEMCYCNHQMLGKSGVPADDEIIQEYLDGMKEADRAAVNLSELRRRLCHFHTRTQLFYVAIPKQLWTVLVEAYGGGPMINSDKYTEMTSREERYRERFQQHVWTKEQQRTRQTSATATGNTAMARTASGSGATVTGGGAGGPAGLMSPQQSQQLSNPRQVAVKQAALPNSSESKNSDDDGSSESSGVEK